jgi:hypothetical protein
VAWSLIALAGAAAASGRIVLALARFIADKTGRSTREAEEAVATAGLSLVVIDEAHHHDDDHRPDKSSSAGPRIETAS